MNIIYVLAHGDTDEIRPSDMDNKLLYKFCLSCLKNVYMIIFSYI